MKREIKFRYWSENDKKMKYGSEVLQLLAHIVKNDLIVANFSQFTGLQDRNGKDIYESDWVLVQGVKSEVKFGNGMFYVEIFLDGTDTVRPTPLGHFDETDLEVVGNTYEH